jgi:hypothetical protein
MTHLHDSAERRRWCYGVRWLGWACIGLSLVLVPGVRGALQFDVFLGYGGQPTGVDGVVREAGWFAFGCELHNDGPGFDAVVEITSADSGVAQTRRQAIELPTNTRKRLVIPVFSSGRGGVWNARLLDSRGRVRAEHTGLRPRPLAWEGLLLGAVPRTFAGAPRLPELRGQNARGEMQPMVARIPVELVPDSPIALEGLDALYLSSEKALELRDPQVEALVSWVEGGGHLVLGVEQPADVNATPWLRLLVPGAVGESVTLRPTQEIYGWLRGEGESTGTGLGGGVFDASVQAGPVIGMGTAVAKYERERRSSAWLTGGESDPYAGLRMEPGFEKGEFVVATIRPRQARVELSADGRPLVVSGDRGRGRVTVLLFSPEREPFRSWGHREWFWARLLRVPAVWFQQAPMNVWGGYSVDGVYGAMIDSRQVQKLPVRWLLLLLVVYLVVIGPLDQYVLKRLNRQMLTWVTFPVYVVFFSLLIYYIGYRLRAGETEWNELHLVDVMPRMTGAEWRGRTYASVYSPVNERYRMSSDLERSSLRGELLGMYGGNRESGRMDFEQLDRGFRADVFVPVWTSQLMVYDWAQSDGAPLEVELAPQGAGLRLTVRNRLDVDLVDMRLVTQGRVMKLGALGAGGTREQVVDASDGEPLATLVAGRGQHFQHKAQRRQQAFGSSEEQWLDLEAENLLAASFVGMLAWQGQERQCVYPAGMDLTGVLERGDAVLLAWVPGYGPVPSLRRFEALRTAQNTWLRMVLPAGGGIGW